MDLRSSHFTSIVVTPLSRLGAAVLRLRGDGERRPTARPPQRATVEAGRTAERAARVGGTD
jgi:hypothetical protein